MARYFLDTEFIVNDFEDPIRLVSIALVCDDGRELYKELDVDLALGNPWFQMHVVPLLERRPEPHAAVRDAVLEFVNANNKKRPEFWAYFASYDWMLLCQLLGFTAIPQWWIKYCKELMQYKDQLEVHVSELPKQLEKEHHALHDARWNRDVFVFLQERERQMKANAIR